MRKVTRGVVSAFLEGRSKRIDNTETDGVSLRLHGNTIAEWRPDGLWITDAGWPSRTTRERLNGLLLSVNPVSAIGYVWTHRGVQHLTIPDVYVKSWDGSWIQIPCNHERSIRHLALIASKQKEVA